MTPIRRPRRGERAGSYPLTDRIEPADPSVGVMERMEGVVSQLVEQIGVLQQRVELLTEVSKEVLLALPSQPEGAAGTPAAEGQEESVEGVERRGFAPFRGQVLVGTKERGEEPTSGQGVDWEQQDKAVAAAAGLEGPGWGEPQQGGQLVQLEDGTWVQPPGSEQAAAAPLAKRTFAPFRGNEQPPQHPKL